MPRKDSPGLRRSSKRLKPVFDAAEAHGWTLDFTGKNHPRLTPPPGTVDKAGNPAIPITFSLTSSDRRGDKNGIARLRRYGVDI